VYPFLPSGTVLISDISNGALGADLLLMLSVALRLSRRPKRLA
jgi:hypothetical protein